jgi:excisionase family DNA binding protein
VTPLWDIKRLCEFLAVSESHAYNLLAKEALPHLHVGGRLRFVPESVEGWVRSRETIRERERDALRRPTRSTARHVTRVRGKQPPSGVPEYGTNERLRSIRGTR